MNKIHIGIIGYGSMGSFHAKYLANGEVPNAELSAICDTSEDNLKVASTELGEKVKFFNNTDKFFASGTTDAVLIVVPPFLHPPLAKKAFETGLHVLTEKPAGVYTKHVHEMNEAAAQSGKTYGIMFNQRTKAVYRKLKDLIDSGELGEIKRTNWVVTDCYRPQSYYDAGGWRATWAGEGGGVLLNQCPHQLDLWQWICGMPKRLRAFCSFGKYHNIEVEDDVTAYVEYPNGATGVFIASTGEAPGSNRLEIAGDCGKVIVEDNNLTFWRNKIPERKFNSEYAGGFGQPECWKCEIPFDDNGEEHKGIMKNFVNAILNGIPLLAPGKEGLNSLELSNGMLLSSWQDGWVDLPVDGDLFYEKLEEKIATSTFKKKKTQSKIMDVNSTF